MNEQFNEHEKCILAVEYEVDVPLVFYLKSDAGPGEEGGIFKLLWLVQVQDVLSEHPESRSKWTKIETFNIV